MQSWTMFKDILNHYMGLASGPTQWTSFFLRQYSCLLKVKRGDAKGLCVQDGGGECLSGGGSEISDCVRKMSVSFRTLEALWKSCFFSGSFHFRVS